MGEAEKRAAHAAYMRGWTARNREKARASSRSTYLRNREKRKAAARAYHHANKKKIFFARIKRAYGLTPELYLRFVARANGCCEICGKKSKLVIDHDHGAGHVRGLLCTICNLRLGKVFLNNWDQKAEAYLAAVPA